MSAFSSRPPASDRRISRIDLCRISPSPYQPRQSFDEASVRELADSIRQFGLLSPLLVRRRGAGEYELIAGERRLRALKLLGRQQADAIVVSAYDRDCALIGLIENLQREDLHFFDEAEACRQILTEHGLTQEELAATLCKSPSALANRLRLLRLSPAVQRVIREFALSERHARCLLRLSDEAEQLRLAGLAGRQSLSVRQLEGQVEQLLHHRKALAARSGCRFLRDNRLVINAVNETVRQLTRIGVQASSRVEPHANGYDIIVSIQSPVAAPAFSDADAAAPQPPLPPSAP